MDQRLIKRILFNQALGCPIALTELVRQYGELDRDQQVTWINSLDMGETGAMMAVLGKINANPFYMLVLITSGYNEEANDTLLIDLVDRAAVLMGQTTDALLEGDTPHALLDAGMIYILMHSQR